MNTQSIFVWVVCGLAFGLANLSYLSDRFFLVWTCRFGKTIGLRLIELTAYGAVALSLGLWLEVAVGQRAPQGWEFFAAFGALFVTLGFPGFVWRYLIHRKMA